MITTPYKPYKTLNASASNTQYINNSKFNRNKKLLKILNSK